MQLKNIVSKLEKEGYTVNWNEKYHYWDVPAVQLEKTIIYIAQVKMTGNTQSCVHNFKYDDVVSCIRLAESRAKLHGLHDINWNNAIENHYGQDDIVRVSIGDYLEAIEDCEG